MAHSSCIITAAVQRVFNWTGAPSNSRTPSAKITSNTTSLRLCPLHNLQKQTLLQLHWVIMFSPVNSLRAGHTRLDRSRGLFPAWFWCSWNSTQPVYRLNKDYRLAVLCLHQPVKKPFISKTVQTRIIYVLKEFNKRCIFCQNGSYHCIYRYDSSL